MVDKEILYEKENFIIFKSENDGYIIQNLDIDNFAHSHIENYKTCQWMIELSLKKKCPYDIPKYLVISLIRLNNDEEYLRKLNEILNKKNKKKEKFIRVNKGRKDHS